MKPFTKRLALVMGVLFTAILCLGYVYIDTLQNYWRFEPGFIRLYVNTNFVAGIQTNTGFIGINTTNSSTSFSVIGKTPATATSGNGSSAATAGSLNGTSGTGGSTTDPTTASGASGGGFQFASGAGGTALAATTNSTGGDGGILNLTTGAGGLGGTVATNASTGGNGGQMTLAGGAGGGIAGAATNGVGGNGGSVAINGGTPAALFGAWSRKGGNGGSVNLTGRNGASGTRTNSGDGGGVTLTAGNSGSTSSGGDPGIAGKVALVAGNGGTGATNANGGGVYLVGGTSSGTVGNVLLNVTTAGAIRGFTGIRVPNPQEALDVQGNAQVSSNLFYTNLTVLVATNSTANTNIVIDYAQAYTDIYLTNNASFTNWVNAGINRAGSINIFITIPSGGTNTLVWPTLGAPSFGVYWQTNQNSSMFTSVTGGNTYAFSDTWAGTNHKVSLTVWK